MDPAIDPFQPLVRLVDRYKRDVNVLNAVASEDAIRAAERHLGHRLPLTLAGFLRRWNGASLFRGALRVRGASELAPPSDEFTGLVAFADLSNGRLFAYAPDGQGQFLFGEVQEGHLVAQHDRFDRWLKGTIHLFDENLLGRVEAIDARLQCDPESGHLLLLKAEMALAEGNPSRAMRLLRKATACDPGNIRGWQRLGELLIAEGDRSEGRFCLVRALRASRLPAPYVGAWVLEPDALVSLSTLFPPGDQAAWQKELESLLGERVTDVRSLEELALYEAANQQLARLFGEQNDFAGARNVLVQGLERARGFVYRGPLTGLVLQLSFLDVRAGRHDEAERTLRGLMKAQHPEALLHLARIVVSRQEPWADQVVADAARAAKTPRQRALAAVAEGERLLLFERLDEAEAAFLSADPEAVAAADKGLEGQICVGLGDVARLRGQHEEARSAYDAAEERSAESGDAELALRVALRRGDLMEADGRREEAVELYRQVAAGYARLELPIREGWACLRLAGCGVHAAQDRARELFGRAEVALAAGIAACDAIAGTPGHSLDWHLERASLYGRRRAEAQRARPPLEPSDADCPERRLGAHRIAIGAAPLGVVDALGERLSRLGRDLKTGSARPTDPNVMAYVAAVDLLAFHRSYEGAQVLLRQLTEGCLPEGPAMALRGALARSPNAALVDGLLEAIEKPGEPGAVAAATEVLGWRRERTASEPLRALLGPQHSFVVRRAAAQALGRIGDREAVEDLLNILDVPQLEETVAISLLLLGDRRGVDFHGQALASGLELSTPPGEIVGRYGGPSYLLLLLGTAAGQESAALAAMQGLGYLGDVRAVPRLLENLSHRDRSRVAVASAALELLTGHQEDPDEPGVGLRWGRWWDERGARMQGGLRYRYGEPLDPALLALTLASADPMVRRGAYDELVITTGCHLPFDSDGPWRVQQSHKRRWQIWAAENREHFPPGGWWFDGQPIG